MKGKTLCAVTGMFLLGATATATSQPITGEIQGLPYLRSYTNHRVSSYDTTGANDDGNCPSDCRDPFLLGRWAEDHENAGGDHLDAECEPDLTQIGANCQRNGDR